MQIVVVGVGNFGSWWLVGLARSLRHATFFCVDPDPARFKEFEVRRDSVQFAGENTNTFVNLQTINHLPGSVDVVVVATNADVRPAVVHSLRERLESRVWVIEKVLAQSLDGLDVIRTSLSAQRAHVNHSRHLQPASVFVKAILAQMGPVTRVVLSGGKYELASNASHFVELGRYWTGACPLSVDTSDLSRNWHPSSTRKNFFDVTGVMEILYDNGVALRLDWTGCQSSQAWRLTTPAGLITYDELSGEISVDGDLVATIPLLDFSDLLAAADVLGIDGEESVALPRLGEVIPTHRMLTAALASHRAAVVGDKSGIIPFS